MVAGALSDFSCSDSAAAGDRTGEAETGADAGDGAGGDARVGSCRVATGTSLLVLLLRCVGGESSASALIAPASTEPDAVWIRRPLRRRGGVAAGGIATAGGDESAADSTGTTELAVAGAVAVTARGASLCAIGLTAVAVAAVEAAGRGDAGRVARTTRTVCSRGALRARGGGGEVGAAASSAVGAASGDASAAACISRLSRNRVAKRWGLRW